MPWLRIDDGFVEHSKVYDLSDRAFRRLIEEACAYNRGERVFGPEVLEEYELVRYGFGKRTRQRWDRMRLWTQFGGRCYLCGADVPADAFHVEHVVPLARGGDDVWSNLNIAHPTCNLRKGARTLEELA